MLHILEIIGWILGSVALTIAILLLNGWLAEFPRFMRVDNLLGVAVNGFFLLFVVTVLVMTGEWSWAIVAVIPIYVVVSGLVRVAEESGTEANDE